MSIPELVRAPQHAPSSRSALMLILQNVMLILACGTDASRRLHEDHQPGRGQGFHDGGPWDGSFQGVGEVRQSHFVGQRAASVQSWCLMVRNSIGKGKPKAKKEPSLPSVGDMTETQRAKLLKELMALEANKELEDKQPASSKASGKRKAK